MQSVLYTNIQRFSLHDGPGIRTTVFLKGCSLRCPWCSNPENLISQVQRYIKDGQEGIYGRYAATDELYTEVMKDRDFYIGEIDDYSISDYKDIDRLPGGVTFSGGECLLQTGQLSPLLKRLHAEHIHTVAESCLFVPERNLLSVIQWIDLFYVDIKILDKNLCRTQIHGDLDLYLGNLDLLMRSKKPVVMRVPVIGGYTENMANRYNTAELIARYASKSYANLLKIELLKEHNLGKDKYISLSECNAGYSVPEYIGVDDDLIEKYREEIAKRVGNMIPVEICKL